MLGAPTRLTNWAISAYNVLLTVPIAPPLPAINAEKALTWSMGLARKFVETGEDLSLNVTTETTSMEMGVQLFAPFNRASYVQEAAPFPLMSAKR